MVRELRRWRYRRQIEDLPPVPIAVAAIKVTVVGIEVSRVTPACVVGVREDADAMGQRVVRTQVHFTGGAALNREQHAMVILRSRIFSRKQISVQRSLGRVLQDQSTPLRC